VGPGRWRVRKPATSTIVKPTAQACSSRRTPVPTSNIALFEAAYQAYVERGDLDVFYRALDPDVEWRAWNDEGNCHGRDEVMALIRSAFDRGVAVEMPPHVDAGDKLVLMPREMPPFFPPDAEGLFQGVEIGDGTIVAIRDFIHRDDAMAAAGL
jgi:limonene-1,2-epoxide hydrolase